MRDEQTVWVVEGVGAWIVLGIAGLLALMCFGVILIAVSDDHHDKDN